MILLNLPISPTFRKSLAHLLISHNIMKNIE